MKFIGNGETRQVWWSDGKSQTEILPFKSQKLVNHSPDGFNWGYGGSGPSQLALAIMLECTTNENALALYQQFKREVIAQLPQGQDFQLDFKVVYDFLTKYMAKPNENLASSTPVS